MNFEQIKCIHDCLKLHYENEKMKLRNKKAFFMDKYEMSTFDENKLNSSEREYLYILEDELRNAACAFESFIFYEW